MVKLSAFTYPVLYNHAPEALMGHDQHVDAPVIPKQKQDPISDFVTLDDATSITLHHLWRFNCRALLDTCSPQSINHQGAFDQVVATGAVDASYIRSKTLTTWDDLGS